MSEANDQEVVLEETEEVEEEPAAPVIQEVEEEPLVAQQGPRSRQRDFRKGKRSD
ncbi:MAG: hypothetical protein HYS75_02335 [Nitrosopumilales archaeon]|nr:hypothetical protein [Nitrosopumilales archaeon]